jgi:hypothetical protein
MGRFYFDKRIFQDKAARWVSFESTAGLEATKKDIYGKCVPCITNLYEQLKEGRTEIRLGEAFRCWKVVAVMDDEQQCVQVLEEFEKRFLGERKLKGRFGSVDPAKTTRVIVFNADDEAERQRLFAELKTCAGAVNARATVSYHRACAELYHDILGDWRTWKETETLKRPELAGFLLEKIRKMLYWES